MPNVLPTIPNDPPQGIQALLDKVYLWNPDVSNELIEKINALLAKLGDAIGAIRPYSELVAPISQYEPCYYGSGVYVAARALDEIPMEFNEADWILIATKGVTAEEAAQTYLPLSGGTMTGRIDFNPAAGTASSNKALISAQTADGLKALFGAKTDENGVLRDVAVIPKLQGDLVSYETILTSFIGNIKTPVTRIHAKKITGGGITDAITIPAKAGTMARLEDLTGGNVSVTFAGQEDTVQNAIDTLKTDQGVLGGQVSTIESKIPADASETNPLVTKNEVLALPTFTYKVVTELPKTGEENIIYLVPKDGSAPDVHDEYIWIESTQTFELIGTTQVDLTDYVKKTDYAGWDKAGIIKAAENLGTIVNGAGYLQAATTLLQAYNAATNFLFVGKGTLENIKYDYVKRAITTNDIVLTDEEKTAAQLWLGINAGGGASLPDQTGNAGKFLTTDGTTASWSDTVVVDRATTNSNTSIVINKTGDSGTKPAKECVVLGVTAFTASAAEHSVAIGYNANTNHSRCVSINGSATNRNSVAINGTTLGLGSIAINGYADSARSTALGYLTKTTASHAIQLGASTTDDYVTNPDANTFKVANANGNFEMMDANGNVPLERLTYVTNQIGDISTALTAILGE